MKTAIIRSILKAAGLILCLAAVFFLSSCSLFDVQETRRGIKVETGDISSQYKLTTVQNMDIEKTYSFMCTYSQLDEEILSFGTDGTVKYVFVSEGDHVKAGDVLAVLDIFDLENEIEECRQKVAEDELLVKQADEAEAYCDRRINDPRTSLSEQESFEFKKQEYREKAVIYAKEIEALNAIIEKDLAEVEASTVTAGEDGIVSEVMDNLAGSSVKAEKTVIVLVKSDRCAFLGRDEEGSAMLHEGDPVTISVLNTGDYPARVTSADPETFAMTFELDEPDYSLAVGTRASLIVTLGFRENVPGINRTAVHSTEEGSYVYVLDESGVRQMRPVEIGLVGNNYVEITGGITSEDRVIIR